MTELRLGLGASGLGNHRVLLSDQDAKAILTEAWASGVRHFDTAPHYGLGLSERRLGDFFASVPRDDFQVSTKVGRLLVAQDNPNELDDEGFLVPGDLRRVWDFSEEGVRASVADSLRRLQLDRLDTVYLHDPERFDLPVALQEGLPALRALQEEGVVGSIGVASMDRDALLAAATSGAVDELMVAGRYTLLDRAAELELLPRCADANISVVAAAVFNGGLLAGDVRTNTTFDYEDAPTEVLTRARILAALCESEDVPLAAAALQFPLRHETVRAVVAGAVEPEQIATNARHLQTEIPAELWERLSSIEVDA